MAIIRSTGSVRAMTFQDVIWEINRASQVTAPLGTSTVVELLIPITETITWTDTVTARATNLVGIWNNFETPWGEAPVATST